MVLHSRKNVAVSSCATNLRGWTPCPLKSFRHGTQRVGKRKDLSCWSDQPTKSGLFWITVMIFLEFQISSWYLLIFGFYTIDSKDFVCRYLLLKLCWFGLSWRNVISVWWNVLAYSPSQVALFITCILKWHHILSKETDLFFGIDHSRLFLALQHKLLSVLKAILLEAKVLAAASAVRKLVQSMRSTKALWSRHSPKRPWLCAEVGQWS